MNSPKCRAIETLSRHMKRAEALCGIVRPVVMGGSLPDGSYTANAGSDIDLIHIPEDSAPQNAAKRRGEHHAAGNTDQHSDFRPG